MWPLCPRAIHWNDDDQEDPSAAETISQAAVVRPEARADARPLRMDHPHGAPERRSGGGEYHLLAYSNQGGGGIRRTKPSEPPGSPFSVHVADARAAFDKARRAGAEEMLAPTRVMPGVTIAVVRAPGGVPVGFAGP